MENNREFIISPEAIKDLGEIWDYIALDSLTNADRFIDFLYKKMLSLSELDGVGRTRNELVEGMLSLPVNRYIIFFTRTEQRIEIARVLSSSGDIETIFGRK